MLLKPLIMKQKLPIQNSLLTQSKKVDKKYVGKDRHFSITFPIPLSPLVLDMGSSKLYGAWCVCGVCVVCVVCVCGVCVCVCAVYVTPKKC